MRWEQVSIGDLFLKKSSNRKQKDLVSEGYPVFGASGLSGFAHDFDVQVPYFGVVKDGAGVGRVSVHPAESSVVGTMECLIPKPELHFEFLGYCLRQIRFERYVTGSTIPHVYFKDYKNEMVALPPLEEQKRIAGILDEADRVRKKTQALIDKYDELAQSLFLEMFKSEVSFSIEELRQEGVIVTHKDGNFGSAYPRKDDFVSDGVPFLSAQNITADGELQLSDVQMLNVAKADTLKFGWIESGDVLLSHNASVGKVAHYAGQFPRALIGTSLTCFRPNKQRLKSHFLEWALKGKGFQNQLRQNMGQTTRNQVPITAQRKLMLPLPDVKKQETFEDYLLLIRAQKARAIIGVESATKNFNALLQKAFKGELT